jgi:hypothetical protein
MLTPGSVCAMKALLAKIAPSKGVQMTALTMGNATSYLEVAFVTEALKEQIALKVQTCPPAMFSRLIF